MTRVVITFILFLGHWIMLSGMLDLWHMGLGFLSIAVVIYLSGDLFFTKSPGKRKMAEVLKFVGYIPFLIKSIVEANIHVIRLALHPKMEFLINPHIVKFNTSLKDELSIVTLANSITLTPGTITVLVDGDTFYVHGVDLKVVEGLPEGLEKRISRIFGD